MNEKHTLALSISSVLESSLARAVEGSGHVDAILSGVIAVVHSKITLVSI